MNVTSLIYVANPVLISDCQSVIRNYIGTMFAVEISTTGGVSVESLTHTLSPTPNPSLSLSLSCLLTHSHDPKRVFFINVAKFRYVNDYRQISLF